MKTTARYFTTSTVTAFLGFALAGGIGWFESRSASIAAEAAFVAIVLCVLEISLSFDNAVVNAKILHEMNAVWRRRFLVWGIPFAVFGMRLAFPLLIVGLIAEAWPWDALVLAIERPAEYAALMQSAHVQVAAFGGAFLLMVALHFFLDREKDTHWVSWIEAPMSALGRVPGATLGVGALASAILVGALPPDRRLAAAACAAAGLASFLLIHLLSSRLKSGGGMARSGAALFVYLEILDASFSFDGVIGAFAITSDIFVIAIGLGVGAMFVRSMTFLLVEKGTLGQFRYLEHGAFYAIAALAFSMFAGAVVHVPEVVPGFASAAILGLSFWSSSRVNRRTAR